MPKIHFRRQYNLQNINGLKYVMSSLIQMKKINKKYVCTDQQLQKESIKFKSIAKSNTEAKLKSKYRSTRVLRK